MAETTTLVTVKDQLVSKYGTALATAGASGSAITVSYAWPGPSAAAEEQVFLGHHPELRDLSINPSHEIPTIKAGRTQRNEEYAVPVTIWVFDSDTTAAAARTVEARAVALFAYCENIHADTPRIGLAPSVIEKAVIGDWSSTLWPFNKGWACALVFDVNVKARLT